MFYTPATVKTKLSAIKSFLEFMDQNDMDWPISWEEFSSWTTLLAQGISSRQSLRNYWFAARQFVVENRL